MSVFATLDDQSPDRFGSGFAGAIALHILIAAVMHRPRHLRPRPRPALG